MEQADEAAVRFTQDVDLVLRREDLGRATEAWKSQMVVAAIVPLCTNLAPGGL